MHVVDLGKKGQFDFYMNMHARLRVKMWPFDILRVEQNLHGFVDQ